MGLVEREKIRDFFLYIFSYIIGRGSYIWYLFCLGVLERNFEVFVEKLEETFFVVLRGLRGLFGGFGELRDFFQDFVGESLLFFSSLVVIEQDEKLRLEE